MFPSKNKGSSNEHATDSTGNTEMSKHILHKFPSKNKGSSNKHATDSTGNTEMSEHILHKFVLT